jgi:hypothetical protein
MAGLDLTKPYHASLLGNIKTYKPAYSRLLAAFHPLYQEALKSHTAPCLACGAPVDVSMEQDAQLDKQSSMFGQITLRCPACGWASNKSLSGLVLGSMEAQRFWRAFPRLRTLPALEIEVQGSSAVLTRLQSLTSSAELSVISRRDTFEQMEVHSNVKF